MAWVLAVRRAWVPFSVERNQSQKPVSAASTETAAPPMNTNVPARKKSCAHDLVPADDRDTSNTAAKT